MNGYLYFIRIYDIFFIENKGTEDVGRLASHKSALSDQAIDFESGKGAGIYGFANYDRGVFNFTDGFGNCEIHKEIIAPS